MFRQLKKGLVKCKISGEEFLPLDVLNAAITKDIIRAALPQDIGSIFRPHLASDIERDAKKVFAILVWIGEQNSISELFSDGLRDRHLPLQRDPAKIDDNILLSADGQRKFRAFEMWDNDAKIDMFFEQQWLVQAPIIDNTGMHSTLHSKCALPFTNSELISQNPNCVVYKAEIHSAHVVDLETAGEKRIVAVKQFFFNDAQPFLLEKKNLENTRNLNHPHLIRHLATFGIDNKYYVIFPWAGGGNLRQYWRRHDGHEREPLWCFQQMLNMVSALEALHSINCRHGDLKPENILHFDVYHSLVIADVGVSKIHEHATIARNAATKSEATTPSYEAPEAAIKSKDPRSRLYDMWSLGCVFLEFIIWLLHGYDSIDSFSEARQPNRFLPSYFYTTTSDKKVAIHPTVKEAIVALQQDPRCEGDTAMQALIALVEEKLLCVSVQDRPTAKTVFQTLESIIKRVESQEAILLRDIDRLPSKPVVFENVQMEPLEK